MTSTILNEQWGAGFLTDQLQEYLEKYFSSEERTSCALFTAGKGKIHLSDKQEKLLPSCTDKNFPQTGDNTSVVMGKCKGCFILL